MRLLAATAALWAGMAEGRAGEAGTRAALQVLAVAELTLLGGPAGIGTFTYDAPERIALLDGGTAPVYPSSIRVSGLNGVVSRVAVTLRGLSHTFPDDIDLLLVGPDGRKVVIFSDAGGPHDVNGLTVRLQDGVPVQLPDNTALTNGTYRPADFESGETFPAPAPTGPYATTFSAFTGVAPNGFWSLHVVDDRGTDAGEILNGWGLEVTTVDPATVTDLGLTLTASPDPVAAGNVLAFSMVVTNRGPRAASNVRLTNALPPDVVFQSVSSSQGFCTNRNGVVDCSFASLVINGSASVTLNVVPLLPGLVTNTAFISAAQPDIVPSNSTATVVATVSPGPFADLRIGVADAPDPVFAGGLISYTVSITNVGPLAAGNTVFTDTLPPELQFVSATTPGGSCSANGQVVNCQLGTLGNGSRVSVVLIAREASGGTTNRIINTVRVSSGTPDLTPAVATATTTVRESADLAVSQFKRLDPTPIGNPFTYTITITNLGVTVARQARLVDTLPSAANFLGAASSRGSCQRSGTTVACLFGDLAPGEGATVFIEVQPNSLQSLVNGAAVSSLTPDPNPTNNLSTDTTGTFPIGTGIYIVPGTNAAELAAAVTPEGLSGLRVTSAQLHSRQVNAISRSGLYYIGAIPTTYELTRPGIVLSTGNVKTYETGPNRFTGTSTAFNQPATPAQELLLDPITGGVFDHFDVTQLELRFDMQEGYDRIRFQVVFGSEEWPEFVGSFVDGFGIYLNGQNIAFANGLPININHPNMMPVPGTELDGVMTFGGFTVLNFLAAVEPGSKDNQLSFIVSDTGDAAVDTTVFVSSFQGGQGPNADLGLTVTSDPEPVIVGSNLLYTLTITNRGPDNATGVLVGDLLPPGVLLLGVGAPPGAACGLFNGNLLICDLGVLDRFDSTQVLILIQPQATGPLTNLAEVISDLPDFISGNNFVELITTVVEFGEHVGYGPILLADASPALPYPSTIQITGLTGVVTRVEASLVGLTHPLPTDLDILLVNPSGVKVMLMSDAGGAHAVDGVTIRFGDDSFDVLPQFDPILEGTWAPTDYEPGDLFHLFPPGFVYATSLSAFNGRTPNGPWSLYIMDDRGVDTGVLASGWRLKLETGPAPPPPVLAVQLASGQVEISWPDTAGAFDLESTPVLGPGAVWTPVMVTPVAGGGRFTVTLPPGAEAAFYRLRL